EAVYLSHGFRIREPSQSRMRTMNERVSSWPWTVSMLACAAALLVNGTTSADDTVTPEARVAAIQEEVAAAERAFRDAWDKQPDDVDDPEVEKLFRAFRAKQSAGFAEVVTIANADPMSVAAFEGLNWLLNKPHAQGSPGFADALTILMEHY